MLISARESSQILALEGLSRQQSRRVLHSGLGRTGAAHRRRPALRRGARPAARHDWAPIEHEDLLAACPGGVLVVRLGPGDEPENTWSWDRRVDAFQRQPYLGFAAWLQVRAYLAVHGRLASVVTVCGYPVLLADLVSLLGIG